MTMIKVGITGQAGFMGTHLYNYLGLQNDIQTLDFKDEFFDDPDQLDNFVKQCDAIVHLAAMNRHADQNVIYNTNLRSGQTQTHTYSFHLLHKKVWIIYTENQKKKEGK